MGAQGHVWDQPYHLVQIREVDNVRECVAVNTTTLYSSEALGLLTRFFMVINGILRLYCTIFIRHRTTGAYPEG